MIFGYDGPEEEAASARYSLEWAQRCHAIKVKELETRIHVLEEENKEWEEYCDELLETPWKKKYDKLAEAMREAHNIIHVAQLDE